MDKKILEELCKKAGKCGFEKARRKVLTELLVGYSNILKNKTTASHVLANIVQVVKTMELENEETDSFNYSP